MREVRLGGLQEEDGAEHVDVVLPVEVVRGDLLQWEVLRDGGVVDDDVDLEFPASGVREVVLGCVDEVGGAVWIAHYVDVSDAVFEACKITGHGSRAMVSPRRFPSSQRTSRTHLKHGDGAHCKGWRTHCPLVPRER